MSGLSASTAYKAQANIDENPKHGHFDKHSVIFVSPLQSRLRALPAATRVVQCGQLFLDAPLDYHSQHSLNDVNRRRGPQLDSYISVI